VLSQPGLFGDQPRQCLGEAEPVADRTGGGPAFAGGHHQEGCRHSPAGERLQVVTRPAGRCRRPPPDPAWQHPRGLNTPVSGASRRPFSRLISARRSGRDDAERSASRAVDRTARRESARPVPRATPRASLRDRAAPVRAGLGICAVSAALFGSDALCSGRSNPRVCTGTRDPREPRTATWERELETGNGN
jgi:hypothetical protein